MRTLALILLACLLTSCASLSPWPSPPKVSLQNIQISDTNATSSNLVLDLAISNPNAVALPIEGVEYQLRLNGYRVVDGLSNRIDPIPAFGTSEVQIQARADLVGIFSLISGLLGGSTREVNYELETRISVQGLWQPIRLVDEGRLPLDLAP